MMVDSGGEERVSGVSVKYIGVATAAELYAAPLESCGAGKWSHFPAVIFAPRADGPVLPSVEGGPDGSHS